jgi:predicted dehydrogenase
MKFLVVGCGSIGERHIRNLQSLSAGEILVHDIDSERLALIGEKYRVRTYVDFDQALKQHIDAFIVCVPPSLHIPFALSGAEHDAHLFIEKPLSHTLDGVDPLLNQARAKGLVVFVGYNLRFHPGLRLVKQFLDEDRIGKVLSATVDAGQYLPDWHPWQDYRQMYTAKKETGGGIILDGSHELDYIRWLLGEVKEVFCFAGKLSSLEVETEDTAEIILKFDNGAMAGVHLDFVQRAYSRSCKLIGEEGTIVWDYPGKKVSIFYATTGHWEEIKTEADPNDMYIGEMKHFVDCIKGEETPVVNGAGAKRVLQIALAAKKSSQSRKIVLLDTRD